jgi:hypothetical protein
MTTRLPNICDACSRRRTRHDASQAGTDGEFVPCCAAFPDAIPAAIYHQGFDHRGAYPGDGGVRFELRDGAAGILALYERTHPAGGQPPPA